MTTLFDDKQTPILTSGLADRMPPRPYQRDALLEFVTAYKRGERKMMVRLATGMGKSFTACLITDWWRSQGDNHRVMMLCYETVLAEQLQREMTALLPWETIGLEMSNLGVISHRSEHQPGIIVASRQTLTGNGQSFRRLDKFNRDENWLLFVDECHGWAGKLKTCGPIFEHFQHNRESCQVGLTGTPQRGDGVSLRDQFTHPVCDVRLSTAIADGYLVPFRQKYITVEGVDFKDPKLMLKSGKDFDKTELDRILSERETVMHMVGPLLKEIEGRRCLVFCPQVATAKAVALAITAEVALRPTDEAWGGAEWMAAKTDPDTRRRTIKRFQAGDFQFLCVCGLCRAGYDDPSLGAVACFRPTKSRVWAEQMKGRAVRPLKGLLNGLHTAEERRAAILASDKPDALVIDLVGVSGMPEVATTAELLLAGESDELLRRVEAILRAGETQDIDEAKSKAEKDIAEEAEARRQREQAEAIRAAQHEVSVRYQVRAREIDEWFSPAKVADPNLYATAAQINHLVALGMPASKARNLKRNQVGGVIASLQKQGHKADYSKMPGRPVSQSEIDQWWSL